MGIAVYLYTSIKPSTLHIGFSFSRSFSLTTTTTTTIIIITALSGHFQVTKVVCQLSPWPWGPHETSVSPAHLG
jgi:hypothetical protein